MRFKNYMNSHSRRNRIYSDEDLLKMQLGNFFDLEGAILAQNSQIGIPTPEELQQSPNTEFVNPYMNEEGLEEGGYWQSVLTPEFSQLPTSPVIPQTGIVEKYNLPELGDFVDPKLNLKLNLENNSANTQNTPEPDDWEPADYTLEGGVEKSNVTLLDNIRKLKSNYEDLGKVEIAQKALSKAAPMAYTDYYGLSSRFNDGDEIPERILKENNIYNINDIQSSPEYVDFAESIAKGKGLDKNNPNLSDLIKNTKVVTPNENSRLYASIKETETFNQWLAENYEKIKEGNGEYAQSIEFPLGSFKKSADDRNAALTIHKADMKNAKMNEDGSMTVDLRDWYDFAEMNKKNLWSFENIKHPINTTLYNKVVRANNRAYNQQQAGQMEPYLINLPLHISKEELEEMLKRKRMKG